MNKFEQLDQYCRTAEKIILLANKDLTNVQILCLAALYSLIVHVYEKESTILIAQDLTHDQQSLCINSGIPLEKIAANLEGYSYTIRIPKTFRENIEHVRFEETEEFFDFIVKTNSDLFDTANIVIEKTNPKFDLLISVDVLSMEDIGEIDYKDTFDKEHIVSISSQDRQEEFSALHIHEPVLHTMQLLTRFAQSIKYEPNALDAQVFLNGMVYNELDNDFENANASLLLDIATTLQWSANMKKAKETLSPFIRPKQEAKPEPAPLPKPSFSRFPNSSFSANRPPLKPVNNTTDKKNIFDPSQHG